MSIDILNPGTIIVGSGVAGNDHPCHEVLEVQEWYNPTITVNTQFFIDIKKYLGKQNLLLKS